MCLTLWQTRKWSAWVSAPIQERIYEFICPHTHRSDWLYSIITNNNNKGIILRLRYKTHVWSWRSFTAGKTRETSFTLMRKTREACQQAQETTGSQSCIVCFVCNSPCVHQFHPIPFDLCLPIRRREKEWVKENKSHRRAFRAVTERRASLRRSDSCYERAHLVAFVSSFTLQRTHTTLVSP